MQKTKHKSDSPLLIGTNELCDKLACGYASAVKFGDSAGARVTIGKRVLWSVAKIEAHIEECAG